MDGLEDGQGQAEVAPEGQAAEAPEANSEQLDIEANDSGALGSFAVPDNWSELNEDQQAIYKSANAHYQSAFQDKLEKDKAVTSELQQKSEMWDMLSREDTRTRLFQTMGWAGTPSAAPQPTQEVVEEDPLPEYLDGSDPKQMAAFIEKRAEAIAQKTIAPHVEQYQGYITQQKQQAINNEFDNLCSKYPDARDLRNEMAPLVDKAGVSIPEAYAMVKTRKAMKDRGLDVNALVSGATPKPNPTPPAQQSTPSAQTQTSGGNIDLDGAKGTKEILLAQAANGDETSIRLVKENGWS